MHLFQIDPVVELALREDIGYGDVTTQLIPGGNREVSARFVAKQPGVLCGCLVARRCFELLDAECKIEFSSHDGAGLAAFQAFGAVQGSLATLLSAERVALNFLQRMSGIASLTRRLSKLAEPHGIRVVETRKTTPGLRLLEKYSVRVGGGHNHRMDLSQAIMLKDNHFAASGLAPGELVRLMTRASHSLKLIAEAVSPQMAAELAEAGADVVLLDNMSPQLVLDSIAAVGGRALIEVSGGIGEDNLADYLLPGVDVISIGALTHSYTALDISLEVE